MGTAAKVMIIIFGFFIVGMAVVLIMVETKNSSRSEWCTSHGYATVEIASGKWSRNICLDDQRRMILPE